MTLQADQSAEVAEMGPIDYLLVEFPVERPSGKALPILRDLEDRKIIRILDLAFIRKDADGQVTTLNSVDLNRMQMIEAALFEGEQSGVISAADLEEAAHALQPGSAAGLLIYENTWAAPFVSALRESGAELVANGRISVQDLYDALESAEQSDAQTTSGS